MLWWEQEYWQNKNKTIEEDTLLIAKQFLVYAHIRCPKPPIRYARGLLQSTLRIENQFHLGMDQVVAYAGNSQAYYMPYTNERWISPHWKGKKNPNENWFDEAIYDIGRLASQKGVKVNG